MTETPQTKSTAEQFKEFFERALPPRGLEHLFTPDQTPTDTDDDNEES